MSKRPANRDTAALRAENTARVLHQIRRSGEIARVDLADRLNLSPATVTTIVTDLVEWDLVRETHALATPGRGRPRIQLTLNPSARYVAGAKLNTDTLTVAILDFVGEVLADVTVPFSGPTIQPGEMVERLHHGFRQAVAKADLVPGDIAGFGLGIPGFIERETGNCHWSPILTGTPIDIRALIQDRIECPVSVDNDANLATLAELWFGHGREHTDFLVVTIEHGVGLGLVIDGRLYRGARGLGAEFGHTKVQIEGALCRCGQRGCLEAYVADFALVREANTALPVQTEPVASATLIDQLADRARSGDPGPASIFRRAGRMLGMGLANLLNLFDPSIIVLTGERMRNHGLLEEGVAQSIKENALHSGRPPVRLAVHRWGDGLWARGAGALALDTLSPPGAGTRGEASMARRSA